MSLTGGEPMGRSTSLSPARAAQRRWVKQEFVAEHLGITKRTVRDMTADGRLSGLPDQSRGSSATTSMRSTPPSRPTAGR